MKSPREEWCEAYPEHTCVDHPNLPCPACFKWTGDGFATVKSIPQCFRSLDKNVGLAEIEFEESGFAVMVRVKWVDGWSWATLMWFPTYEEAVKHSREGQKVVSFGSAEWTAMRNERSLQHDDPYVHECATSGEKVHV